MTPFIIVILCIISGLIAWNKEKDLINPISLFCLLWAICVFLASIRLFNLMEVSDTTYLYILIGIIGYILGGAFGSHHKLVIKKRDSDIRLTNQGGERFSGDIEAITNINYKLWYIFIIIIYAYCIWRLMRILPYIRNGYSWWNIRLMATTGEGGYGTIRGSFIYQAIYNWVVSPIVYILAPTMLVDLFVGKRNKAFITLSLGAIISYSIVTVSRSIWGFSIIYMVILLFIFRKRIHLSNRMKRVLRWIPVLVVIVFVVIVYITFMRNDEASILTNAYVYLAGGIPLFDLHLGEAISQGRTYGMLTFSGFLYPIFFLLTRTQLFSYPSAFLLADEVKNNLEIFHYIGNNIHMNAYATLFYDFYIDFGVVGIVLLSFIFGYICFRCYRRMIENLDLASLVTYLLICQYILFSMARIYSTLTTRAISFVWIPILLSQYHHISFRIKKKDRI